MKIKDFLKRFFRLHVFNPEWSCSVCGKENFDGGFVCKECEGDLPYNDKMICEHCGRKTEVREEYCVTCKENMLSVDKARSVFSYEKAIRKLITSFKYDNCRYLAEYFGDKLTLIYLKNCFNADGFCYIPMTEKAERKRGYNQSKLLAERVAFKTGVPILDCLVKTKQTTRQAKLKRKERLENLKGVFKVNKRKIVKDKTLVIIDDVTTTGATAEVIAKALKKAGAKAVYLLTVASTPAFNITNKNKQRDRR